MAAGAVQLKLRYEGFETLTRQMPRAAPDPRIGADLRGRRRAAAQDAGRADRAVRLIGLTAINLTDVQQLTLFDEPDKTDRITKSIDAVRERFGEKAITRARLIGHGDKRRFDFGERPEATDRSRRLDKSNTCSYAPHYIERLFGALAGGVKELWNTMALTRITPTPRTGAVGPSDADAPRPSESAAGS